FPLPDTPYHNVAFDPFLKGAPPILPGESIPARTQTGDGDPGMGKDFYAPCAIVGLAPADGRWALELQGPALWCFVQRGQLFHCGIPHPGMTPWCAPNLADAKMQLPKANSGQASVPLPL